MKKWKRKIILNTLYVSPLNRVVVANKRNAMKRKVQGICKSGKKKINLNVAEYVVHNL